MSIQLLPSQLQHYNRLRNIMSYSRVYIDTSLVGAGKTYVSLYIASQCKMSVIVICPVNVHGKWMSIATKYGITAQVMTYDKLACGGERQLKINDSVMLIVDEFHYVIHECKRTNALFSLASKITKTSYVGFLSATPFTKESELDYFNQQIMNITNPNQSVLHKQRATFIHNATNQYLNRDIATEVSLMLGIRPIDYIRAISSKVCNKDFSFSKLDISNSIYRHTSDESQAILSAIRSAYQILGDNSVPNADKYNIFMRVITKHMASLEMIKCDNFVNAVLSTAYTHKNVVFVNYREPLLYIMNTLSHLNPVCIHGSINGKNRLDAITRFNTDDSVRLIVCNTKATCCGIDLDDKSGNAHRAVYISPSFDYSNMLQAVGRVYRIDSKSLPLVRFIYAEHFVSSDTTKRKNKPLNEYRLLCNIERKSRFIGTYNTDLCFPTISTMCDI